jgi:uncharacterized protein (TIGR02466 family)
MVNTSPFGLNAEMCWPTLLFHRSWQDHAQHSPELIRFLYQLRDEQQSPISVAARAKSRVGLYESGFDLFAMENASLKSLIGFISNTLAAAVCQADPGRLQPQQLDMAVTESWFHITSDGGFHDAHLHPNCSWGGVYYVQIGDSGPSPSGGTPNGGSRFYSPLTLSFRDAGNRYLFDELDVPIQDGMLILFPSYLRHSGLPYKGKCDRIVVAFNARIFIKGVPSNVRP